MFRALAAILFIVFAAPENASGEPGVFDDRIVFGQSAAFEGPAAALGLGMRDGIRAAFHEANEAGGVNRRKLELISYNDGYEPEKAIANVERLIDDDKVFALTGEVGTPTSKAVQPIATDQQVPFLGPLTRAAFLRDTSLDNVVLTNGENDNQGIDRVFLTVIQADGGFKAVDKLAP